MRHLSDKELISVAERDASTDLERELLARLIKADNTEVVEQLEKEVEEAGDQADHYDSRVQVLEYRFDTAMDRIADICDEFDLENDDNSALAEIREECIWSEKI